MVDKNSAVTRMETHLRNTLARVKVKGGEPFTHTTKSPGSSYYIGEDDIETFLTVYCNAISNGVRPTVTEKPGAYGPLRFDFDFKSSLDDGLIRKYDDYILTSIVGMIQEEIVNAVAPEAYDDKILWCVVLEKSGPRVDEGRIKDGFHLHFPNFVCEGWFQDEYMRTKITERMIKSKIWQGIKFMDPVDKFIDTNMARKQWLMYGSAKAEGAEPFLMTKAYSHVDLNTGEATLIDEALLFETEMEGRASRVGYYLPRFLSIQGYQEYTPLKKEIETRRATYRTKKAKRGIIVKKRSAEDVMADLAMITEGDIMSMLADDRAEDYNSWIDVGWTLFNIGQGCDEALDLWINFSRRSAKFTEGECEERWAKMEMRDKTIGSLFAMARADDPNAYKAWKDMNLKTWILRSLGEPKPNEWDIAQVVYKLYRDRFLCADAKRDMWFEFVGHRWQCVDDNVTLKKLFATEMVNLYFEYKVEAVNNQRGKTDKELEELQLHELKCIKIITALKESTFHKKLIEMCKVVFHDSTFLRKIDENKLLFVCENGVLDLELMCFRDGRPDDFCTISCNVTFPRNASPEDDEYIEVQDYLRKVFPNVRIRKYFKDTACGCLEGGNVNKTFIVGTGGGDNAKTVTYTFLELTFGEYCIKFPRELFVTGKGNSSSGPRPELARVRGKRLAMVSEIAKTETLNIGVLKELTGNDSFFARGMFEKGTDIKPMFTLFMSCAKGNTAIGLPGGFSMPLDQLSNNSKIMSWDSKTNGIKPALQKKFLKQGKKDCVKLTLKDGSIIECTPDHRLLTKDGEWIEARNIKLGETELMMGANQPYYDDLQQPTNYKFLDGIYDLNTLDGKLKAMTVCRILGYGLADGTLNTSIYMGHIIDTERILDDIEFVTGKRPAINKCNTVYKLHIPVELRKQLSILCKPQPGGRINNPMILPEFMFDAECPLFLIRETLAGMFGGDGVIPCINASGKSTTRKMFSPIKYIASKITKYVPSLQEQFQRIVDILQNRFGIESMVEKPLEYIEGKSHVQININKYKSVKTFIEKIGVRYCCHKEYRLTAVLSYYKFKESIIKQNENIVQRTKELIGNYENQHPTAKIEQYSLQDEYIQTFNTTQQAQHATGINHSLINSACKRNGKSKGYIWKYSTIDEIISSNPKIHEEECKTMKEAFQQAITEQKVIYCLDKLVTYTQLRHRILKGSSYTQQQNNDLLLPYLEETGLIKFCNTGRKTTYAVDAGLSTLPCYYLTVIGREDIGVHQVYDMTVETPYSNYMSNGMISHNCNEPPKVPGHDDATWNRIRVVDYESKFVKSQDLDKFPVPESEEEQFEMKRFIADNTFTRRLPELAPYMLYILFENYKEYKKTGLKEPPEVNMATNVYRAMNDVYLQFIDECIRKVTPAEIKQDTEQTKYFMKLPDLHAEFTNWYHENNASYAREKFNKLTLMHEFNKRFPGDGLKKGRIYGWYGYELVIEEISSGPLEKAKQLHDILLAGKVSKTPVKPKIKAKTINIDPIDDEEEIEEEVEPDDEVEEEIEVVPAPKAKAKLRKVSPRGNITPANATQTPKMKIK